MQYVAIISLLFGVIGVVPYLYSIFRGTTRPQRTTWFIWTILLLIGLLAYRAEGATESIWFLVGDFLITSVVFLVSLWKGAGGSQRQDIVALGIALTGVALWLLFDSVHVALLGSLAADAAASWLTLRKAVDDPLSENATTYYWSAGAAALGFVAVGTWDWTLMSYPLYLMLANGLVAYTILLGTYHAKMQRVLRYENSHP